MVLKLHIMKPRYDFIHPDFSIASWDLTTMPECARWTR